MKKFLLILLSVALALSMAACDSTETTDGTQNSSPNTQVSTDSSDKEDISVDSGGGMLSQAFINQFSKAASMKLEFNADVVTSSDSWNEENINEKNSTHSTASYVITVARSGDSFDLKIDEHIKSDGQTKAKRCVLYIVDGAVYQYDQVRDAYFVSEAIELDTEKIEAQIKELMESEGVTDEDVNSVLESLGAELIYAFNIIDGRGSASMDCKDAVNKVLAYLSDLEADTKTVGELLNDAPALIDPSLSATDVIKELENVYSMTLGECLEALDAQLVSRCGMTAEELYNTVMSNEAVAEILAESNLELPESFNIPEEYKSKTVYELTGSTVPLEELMDNVEASLEMTLTEAETSLGISFSDIITLADALTVDALDYKIELCLTDLFKIESVNAELNFGITVTAPSVAEGKNDVDTMAIKLTAKLYDISSTEIKISAPEDKTLIYTIFIYEYVDENEGKLSFTIGEKGEVSAQVETNIGTVTGNVSLDAIDGYVIVITDLYAVDYNLEMDGELKIQLDTESFTFTVIE